MLLRLGYRSDIFSKIHKVNPSLQRKQLIMLVIKFQFSSENQNFGKPLSINLSSTVCQYLKTFLMRSAVIIANLIFKIFCQEIGQYLEDLYNSLNQHLSNDVRTSCVSERQDRHLGVDVTEYKMFIDMVSDSTVQLTFKKLPFVLVQYQKRMTQSSEKTSKIHLPFLTTYMYGLDFLLHIVQPKQQCNALNSETDTKTVFFY